MSGSCELSRCAPSARPGRGSIVRFGVEARAAVIAGALLVFVLLTLGATSQARAETTPPPDVVVLGEPGGDPDSFGWCVAPAGDVNGDGIADIVIGAPTYDAVAGFAGRAYLFYGPITSGVLEAADADATITAQTFGDNLGVSVASAGDTNNDGRDDLIIGARSNDAAGTQAGRAYLFLGPVTGARTADQANAIVSGIAFEELGWSVAGAGDLDDDGFDDVILGAHQFGDTETFSRGRAYMFRGPLSGPRASSSADAIITGEFTNDMLGTSVAPAGDVNSDGIDDVIMGAPHGPVGFVDPGRAYVFLGPISGEMSAAAADVILRGETDNDNFGTSVAGAGDVNGDGIDDVIVGADQLFSDGPGRAQLYSGPLDPNLGPIAPTAVLIGETADDVFGYSVAGAGDVNGDGFDDVLVGAWDNGAGGARSGRAYLFFGPLEGLVSAADADVIITGAVSGDELGHSVASAGDLDANGRADLFVGAPQFFDQDAGKAYIFFDAIAPVGVAASPTGGALALAPAAPNPFAGTTRLAFRTAHDGEATLRIVDPSGRRVRQLAAGPRRAGEHTVVWDGRADDGRPVAAGRYIAELTTPQGGRARTLTLLR
jgi:FlgD Ig-like domain/FG-GAP repeat